MPRPKPKSKSDTRSVPIPSELWDTAGRQSEARAVIIRQAMREYFERRGIEIYEDSK